MIRGAKCRAKQQFTLRGIRRRLPQTRRGNTIEQGIESLHWSPPKENKREF
jgi:hypothetical protein